MTNTSVQTAGAPAASPQYAPINHDETGVPLTHRHCTVCNKVVYLNRFGRCPSLVGQGQTRKPFVRPESPVTVTVPVVGRRGTRYTCNETIGSDKPHGEVTLNVRGQCPRCMTATATIAWADYRAQQAEETAASQEASDDSGATVPSETGAAATDPMGMPDGAVQSADGIQAVDVIDDPLMTGQALVAAVSDVFDGKPDDSTPEKPIIDFKSKTGRGRKRQPESR